jgi:cobalamin biosynthesis protein CobD/CbiB
VSYGLLTAGLVGLYLLVVALLRPLLEPVTGSSALAVAASTLAVAAAFNPARRRLQEAVDRRFDRARYDAARAVDDFAARLRNQVDLDEITDGLCETVAATVAPGRVAVWLRAPAGLRGPRP